MKVRQILDEKGRDVVTVPREMELISAARFLSEQKIGAVVVSDGADGIAGILSERDIVRAVSEKSAAALEASAATFMTKEVVTCSEEHTVNQVMEIMTRGRFRHLPVVENGKIVGIISIGDVVRRRIEEIEREAEEIKAYIAS
ncbi:CBS domain-containing protein [Pseudohoeflea coraliihabitans]|uniref:CBS domain-containing protein n=1 Tax=Pseudohoeflea coraliihabitans TaxID=2860393 RepID=A0ABS6WQL9_9HYPH|nr:CBS domain-containing protein [Pseudohoeflea sp. DP4N28-3]